MKKALNYVFLGVIIVLLLAMVVHVAVAYVSIYNDSYTGAPANVAFFLLIPYGIAVVICFTAWAIANKIADNKNKHKANTDKCN